MITIRACSSAADYALAIQLTRDYLAWLDLDLAYQGVADELQNFPTMYGPPSGLFLLAYSGSCVAGGVGLRTLEPGVCEMKRLYVYDRFKREGAGRKLCEQLIDQGSLMGFKSMRLDTLARMQAAVSLYSELGFKKIEPYCFNPDSTAIFMQHDLQQKTDV